MVPRNMPVSVSYYYSMACTNMYHKVLFMLCTLGQDGPRVFHGRGCSSYATKNRRKKRVLCYLFQQMEKNICKSKKARLSGTIFCLIFPNAKCYNHIDDPIIMQCTNTIFISACLNCYTDFMLKVNNL